MGKIAFLFPGQGAQHVGMGRSIAEKLPAARQLYEQADEILGFPLSRVCFEGPAAELDTTAISQPAIFVTSLAALELLRAENPQAVESCDVTAGLSLGEYTALVFAGAMSFADGLRVVKRRGEAMQEASDATPSGNGERAAPGPRESRVDSRTGVRRRLSGDRQLPLPGQSGACRARRRPVKRRPRLPQPRAARPCPWRSPEPSTRD